MWGDIQHDIVHDGSGFLNVIVILGAGTLRLPGPPLAAVSVFEGFNNEGRF
jgi:hypothetical protein